MKLHKFERLSTDSQEVARFDTDLAGMAIVYQFCGMRAVVQSQCGQICGPRTESVSQEKGINQGEQE
jgi:hypothetical protein